MQCVRKSALIVNGESLTKFV